MPKQSPLFHKITDLQTTTGSNDMEIAEKKYVLQVADLGDFDLDDDRSIDSSIAFELKQAGIPAKVYGNEHTRDTVEIETSATLDELKKVFQDADLAAEIDMKEDEQYVRTGPGHFKQDDFVSSVKKSKKFKYVSAKQGDNALADEDTQTKTNEAEEKLYTQLKEEYSKFVEDAEEKKRLKNQD